MTFNQYDDNIILFNLSDGSIKPQIKLFVMSGEGDKWQKWTFPVFHCPDRPSWSGMTSWVMSGEPSSAGWERCRCGPASTGQCTPCTSKPGPQGQGFLHAFSRSFPLGVNVGLHLLSAQAPPRAAEVWVDGGILFWENAVWQWQGGEDKSVFDLLKKYFLPNYCCVFFITAHRTGVFPGVCWFFPCCCMKALCTWYKTCLKPVAGLGL